jgi:MFS family permease
MHTILRNKLLLVTYALTFLYALHYAIPIYATSSFLNQYFRAPIVSALYVVASVCALLASMSIAKSIRRFHTYPFTFFLVIAEIITTVTFAFTKDPYVIAIFFIIHFILQVLLYVLLNVFIEGFSKHAETGSIRGLFLALFNLGVLISPLIGGLLLSKFSFQALYLVASLTLVPFLYFLHAYLQHIKEPAYHSIDIWRAVRDVLGNRTLKVVFITEVLVQSFYSVMVIYSPLYLTSIGIPLTTYMSYILPIALIPLVLLPFELGFLADTKISGKTILLTGIGLLIITLFLCVIVRTTDPRIWTLILIVSRIGASCVETMSFTFYFKKVGPEDASLTALFSNAYGLGTIFVGSAIFLISPFLVNRPQLVFVVLGCILLWSMTLVLSLKDIPHHKRDEHLSGGTH